MHVELSSYRLWVDAEIRAKQARSALRVLIGSVSTASETHEAAMLADVLSHEAHELFEAAMSEMKDAAILLAHDYSS